MILDCIINPSRLVRMMRANPPIPHAPKEVVTFSDPNGIERSLTRLQIKSIGEWVADGQADVLLRFDPGQVVVQQGDDYITFDVVGEEVGDGYDVLIERPTLEQMRDEIRQLAHATGDAVPTNFEEILRAMDEPEARKRLTTIRTTQALARLAV